MTVQPPSRPTDTDILNRTRILAIDDDPLVIETYRRLFRERVETSSAVADGVGKLRKDENLRIILLDFEMRDGGVPLLKILQRRFPERLAIVLFEKKNPLDPLQIKDLGVFRCLEKNPATYALLEATVKEGIGLLRLRARTP